MTPCRKCKSIRIWSQHGDSNGICLVGRFKRIRSLFPCQGCSIQGELKPSPPRFSVNRIAEDPRGGNFSVFIKINMLEKQSGCLMDSKMSNKLSAARKLIHIAKNLLHENRIEFVDSMTHDEILDFLDSQVKTVEIIVHLPEDNVPDNGSRKAADKHKNKKNGDDNEKLLNDIENEQNEIDGINEKLAALEKARSSLPPDNNGHPFYGDLAVKVLKTRAITVKFTSRNRNVENIGNLDPYDNMNKNNPFIYEGINTVNDYRDFIISRFAENKMVFKECIVNPYDFDMPLDIYITTAVPLLTKQEINVYVKFGIHKNTANFNLEFENFSFHPSKKQSDVNSTRHEKMK